MKKKKYFLKMCIFSIVGNHKFKQQRCNKTEANLLPPKNKIVKSVIEKKKLAKNHVSNEILKSTAYLLCEITKKKQMTPWKIKLIFAIFFFIYTKHIMEASVGSQSEK